jgi:hypothetical protein
MENPQREVIIIREPKSMAVAVLLALFFGPLGLLYASVLGGLIMLGINLVILVIGTLTFGIGYFLFPITWLICVIWAIVAVQKDNASTTVRR